MAQAGRGDLHSDYGERLRRAATVRRHRELYGDWCPGWGVPSHPARDLTADHSIPHAIAGHGHGALGVLCRACNGRKGKRVHAPDPTPEVRSRNWVN